MSCKAPIKCTQLQNTVYLKGNSIQDYVFLKVNESRYTVLTVVTGSIKKLCSIDFVKLVFSQYFSQ